MLEASQQSRLQKVTLLGELDCGPTHLLVGLSEWTLWLHCHVPPLQHLLIPLGLQTK